MSTKLHIVKEQIKRLYQQKRTLHISVSVNYSRVLAKKIKAEITGVYPNLFSVESANGERHIFQYVDVLTGNLEIAEMVNIA